MFKLNPDVSDIAEGFGTNLKGVTLLVLGAIEAGGSGCACPESVLIRALVSDLVLHRKDALIMDMEAGIEHLGRATAKGVDTLLVMVEPSQRAIDSAHRVARLGAEIGLRDIRFVANKIASPADEEFVRASLVGHDIVGVIPWSEEIRQAERRGAGVVEGAGPELLARFQGILEKLRLSAASTVFSVRRNPPGASQDGIRSVWYVYEDCLLVGRVQLPGSRLHPLPPAYGDPPMLSQRCSHFRLIPGAIKG